MLNWLEVWERKGNQNTTNVVELDGFEHTSIDPTIVAKSINQLLEIKESDLVLEVGCGAGMIAQHMNCQYVGVDYSKSLLKKFIEIQKKSALFSAANDLPFKDKYFDKTYVFSVFQYFPDHAYANQVVNELKRVTKKSIFIGDISEKSPSADHLLYTRSMFADWKITEGFYNPLRFNALLEL